MTAENLSLFEKWVLQPPEKASEDLSLKETLRAHPDDREKAIRAYEELIKEKCALGAKLSMGITLLNNEEGIHVVCNNATTLKALEESGPHVQTLTIGGNVGKCKIENISIKTAQISLSSNNSALISFKDCVIGKLIISGNHAMRRLNFYNNWIGQFSMQSSGIMDLYVARGTIRDILCPPPRSTNPFSGNVTFKDVVLPTRRGTKVSKYTSILLSGLNVIEA